MEEYPALHAPACSCCQQTRRSVLRGALATMMAGAAVAALPAVAFANAPVEPAMAADEVIKRLLAGNARYASGQATPAPFDSKVAQLAGNQRPHTAILSCSDSRVTPEFVFDKGQGELFVIRNAGNLVGTQALASLEYAVQFLGVSVVMVLGHSGCGAVASAIDMTLKQAHLPGHLDEVIGTIGASVARAKRRPGELIVNAVEENVRRNASELEASGPILSNAVLNGRIRVVGAVYDLSTGRVAVLD